MNKEFNKIPIVLTIAGSDSSGGAGIQADIKTLSAIGVYSASVITTITAQNTCEVSNIYPLPSKVIQDQLTAVFDDLEIDSVKIGMLHSNSTIQLVVDVLKQYKPKNIILDPVMISSSGKKLLEDNAISTLKYSLMPLTTLITPNIPEAAALLEMPLARSKQDMADAIKSLNKFGAKAVLLKGGHLDGDICYDLLLENDSLHEFSQVKINSNNTHGTGCTLSSAIAGFLALGSTLTTAVSQANQYVNSTIKHSNVLDIGHGNGPVHHFYNQW